jgi:hypothetical protein
LMSRLLPTPGDEIVAIVTPSRASRHPVLWNY